MRRAFALPAVFVAAVLGAWWWRGSRGAALRPLAAPTTSRAETAPERRTPPAAAAPPLPADAPCRPVPPTARLIGARLLGRGSAESVVATVMPPDAGSGHAVYLGERSLGSSRVAALLKPQDIGAFALGEELDFSLRVKSPRVTYWTGSGERNHDRKPHAGVIPLGDAWMLGFEDTEGGGDGDFDDAIVMVKGEVAAEAGGKLWCLPGPAR